MKWTLFFIAFLGYVCVVNAQVHITPVFGNQPILEEKWYISSNGDSIQFENIRFYLSEIRFEMADGEQIKDPQKAHLIDIFEPTTLKIALNNAHLNNVKKMYFNIGIDSLTSVTGALGGDLDPSKGMYWAWQSGYINMKIEGKSPQCKNRKNEFQFHLGGYMQPFYGLKSVELPVNGLNNTVLTLKVDVSKFFQNIHISNQKSIMIPCKEAMQLADYSIPMFSIQAHEK